MGWLVGQEIALNIGRHLWTTPSQVSMGIAGFLELKIAILQGTMVSVHRYYLQKLFRRWRWEWNQNSF